MRMLLGFIFGAVYVALYLWYTGGLVKIVAAATRAYAAYRGFVTGF